MVYSTDYYNTFIETAEDCPATCGEVPPLRRGNPSVATLQFDMLHKAPYQYTSDEALFQVFAIRKGLGQNDWQEKKGQYFSKGQPCFRASPLVKRYGWGVHSNENGRIALYGVETREYKWFVADQRTQKVKGMSMKRKRSHSV